MLARQEAALAIETARLEGLSKASKRLQIFWQSGHDRAAEVAREKLSKIDGVNAVQLQQAGITPEMIAEWRTTSLQDYQKTVEMMSATIHKSRYRCIKADLRPARLPVEFDGQEVLVQIPPSPWPMFGLVPVMSIAIDSDGETRVSF